MSNTNIAWVGYPIAFLLTVGLFFFVLKLPKDLGIYLGWIPSLVFLLTTVFTNSHFACIIAFAITLAVYITATVLRINKNKKLINQAQNSLREIDKMSITDL